jgi:23S rRNA pseudouridine2605 synthase
MRKKARIQLIRMSERLQKVLARAGIGSRRHCEDLIRAGRVRVNGRVAVLGERVDIDQAQITIDEVPIDLPTQFCYIKFHKPAGYLSSTRSQGGRPTIYELVPITRRVYPVGRLDLYSEGLILLTDDGNLTQRLTHPRYQHEKEYRVLFEQSPNAEQISLWQEGVRLPDGYITQPAHLSIERLEQEGCWCRVVLREGRKRQIRSMAAVLGLTVLRLIRIRIASLKLGSLTTGQWEECSAQEVQALQAVMKNL